MSEKFRRYLRDNGYNLSNDSRKLISKHVRKVYAKHVKIARAQAQEISGPTSKHRYPQNARPIVAPLQKVPRNSGKTPQADLKTSTSNSSVLNAQEVLEQSDLNDSAQLLSQEGKQDRTQDSGQVLSQGVVLKTSSTFTEADNNDKALEGTSLETVESQGPFASNAARCDFCRYKHGKCVRRDTSCTTCIARGLPCSFESHSTLPQRQSVSTARRQSKVDYSEKKTPRPGSSFEDLVLQHRPPLSSGSQGQDNAQRKVAFSSHTVNELSHEGNPSQKTRDSLISDFIFDFD